MKLETRSVMAPPFLRRWARRSVVGALLATVANGSACTTVTYDRGPVAADASGQIATSVDSRSARVSLESNASVSLQEFQKGDGSWRHVCAAPCVAEVDPRSDFRLDAKGLSEPITLERGPQYVRADVGSPPAHTAGIVLTSIGVASALGGAILFDLSTCRTDCPDSKLSGPHTTGALLLVTGVVATIVGIVLAEGNRNVITLRQPITVRSATTAPPGVFVW